MPIQIHPDLFQLKIPMPEKSLDHLNAYVVRSNGRTLVVDTGLNDPMCMTAMQQELQALKTDWSKTDLFITHLHGDHFGLAPALSKSADRMYLSRIEAELMMHWQGWQPLTEFALAHGFPEQDLAATLKRLPYHHTRMQMLPGLRLLNDGDQIQVGDYGFVCLTTPGHSHGHMCLYEPRLHWLIAGDHILEGITPSLQCWSEDRNSLGSYLTSLDRVDHLEVDLVLPGHNALIADHHLRIAQIKLHHDTRCREILDILGSGPQTGFQVAAGMSWDIDLDGWDDFPLVQKWFAFGEAMAHLKYLEKESRIIRSTASDRICFQLSSTTDSLLEKKYSC